MKIANIINITDKSFGGKAYGLSLLSKGGLQIPKTICIEPASSVTDFDDLNFQHRLRSVVNNNNGKYSVAVRSSSLIEDTLVESKAGHFLTRIGVFSFCELIQAIKDVYLSGDMMGVIVQEFIAADLSGVFFSSDPLSYSKRKGILSYVPGLGEELVSGKAQSTDIDVSFGDPLKEPLFNKIANEIKSLEVKLGYPIDVEWCIKDSQLFYLQCRPITSITSIQSGYYGIDNLAALPSQLCLHNKIQLRIEARQTDTFISNAYIHVNNSSVPCSEIGEVKTSLYCKGFSVVIIYPERISEKVIRSFVGSEKNISQSIGRCYRYGIRSYPEHNDLSACLKAFHEKAAEDYWITATIIQEVFDAVYTGILQRVENGYLVEVTKGHFLTKGNVLTSQYYVERGEVKSKSEVHQETWYRIIQGHVIECHCCDEPKSLVALKDNEIVSIIESFRRILRDSSKVIEFGIIQYEHSLVPYLIDSVDSNDHLQSSYLKEGIISCGRRKGAIRLINGLNASLDTHFHDERETTAALTEDLIFVCETPSISLLNILDKYDNSRIAFAFSDGSILCHLAVVLRERGIPAIKCGETDCREGDLYLVDAETPGLHGEERLIRE